ncbi:MAG: Rieske 2Fe-2S domain-containing protein [Acidobacteriota bacterium]
MMKNVAEEKINKDEAALQEAMPVERRSFLGLIIGLITAGIGSTLAAIIGRYSVAPAFAAPDESNWVEVGLLEEIPEDVPIKRNVVISQTAGWGRFNSQQLVWVTKKADKVEVFSAVCPHLGCTINETKNGFACACHGSVWSSAGERKAGPAPRDMDVLEHKIEGDVLKVKYRYFKQGIEKKEELS